MRTYPLLLAVVLGACSADRATPTEPMVDPPSFAKAAMDNQMVPIEGTIYSPCTDATVELAGSAHLVTRTWEQDGLQHRAVHLNTLGISGVSDEGIRYNYIVNQKVSEVRDISDGLPWNYRATSRGRLVTSGKHTGNYEISITLDLGYDADGNLYSNIFEYNENCR